MKVEHKNEKLSVIVDWLEFTVLEAQMPEVMKLMKLKWDNFHH